MTGENEEMKYFDFLAGYWTCGFWLRGATGLRWLGRLLNHLLAMGGVVGWPMNFGPSKKVGAMEVEGEKINVYLNVNMV